MKRTNLLLTTISLFLLASCTKDIQSPGADESPAQATASVNQTFENGHAAEHVPNEFLVKFKAGTTESQKSALFARVNGKVKEHVVTAAMKQRGDQEGFYLVHTPLQALEAIAKARGAEVVYAEPNFIYRHVDYPNDTYYANNNLWGMYGDGSVPANQYGSQAAELWNTGKTGASGATVYVGIIDEGVMNTHVDLSPNVVQGHDFVNNDNSTFDGLEDDHGTHVAGTIGAVGGNGKGVAGMSWNVKMIPAKFLGRNGGTTVNAIKAVDYITNLKNSMRNIVATNNSWGGGGFSQGLKDAITRANAAGILFIAAAGNNGTNNDNSESYPSNYDVPNVIAVAAIDKNGGLASFSQYGATTVDLGAPGVGIYSTLPVRSGKNIVSGYGSYSGTSMATPHVTGAAALYAAYHTTASAADIKAAIISSAVHTPSLAGKCVTGGRLNVSGF